MRSEWLFLVGISVLGCKDKQSPAPAGAPAGSAAPKPAGSASPTPTPEHSAPVTALPSDRPTLEKAFDDETEDKAWADATEKAIAAVAPELSGVSCRQTQCEATVTGPGLAQVAMTADKLEGEDKLPSTGAKNVLLTGPETDATGKTTMKIFIRYER